MCLLKHILIFWVMSSVEHLKQILKFYVNSDLWYAHSIFIQRCRWKVIFSLKMEFLNVAENWKSIIQVPACPFIVWTCQNCLPLWAVFILWKLSYTCALHLVSVRIRWDDLCQNLVADKSLQKLKNYLVPCTQ